MVSLPKLYPHGCTASNARPAPWEQSKPQSKPQPGLWGRRGDRCSPSLAACTDFLIWRAVKGKCTSSEGNKIPRFSPTICSPCCVGPLGLTFLMHSILAVTVKVEMSFLPCPLSLPVKAISSMMGAAAPNLFRHSESKTRAPISWSHAQVHPVKDKGVVSTLLGFWIGPHRSLVSYKLITGQKWCPKGWRLEDSQDCCLRLTSDTLTSSKFKRSGSVPDCISYWTWFCFNILTISQNELLCIQNTCLLKIWLCWHIDMTFPKTKGISK